MKITLSNRILMLIIVIALLLSTINTYIILGIRRDYRADDSIFSYVILQEESTYEAKNQASGLIDFSSPTASFVINEAVAQGSYVYIKSGVYPLASDVQILNKKSAKIISDGATIVGNGHNIIIKGDNYTTSQYNEVSGLNIVNATLRIENSFATIISDITIENSTVAIELDNTDTWTEGTRIDNIHFVNCIESIAFRTPTPNGTGSYASTEITRCFFNMLDNSVGINVEKKAEFSDSQLLNSRLWLGENGNNNQTGLRVDGSMFQTLLSSVVFESFADTPENVYAIVVGENANPAPIIDAGVSFLGDWTARIYNPYNVWLSGTGSVFRRSESIPIGTSSQYGETVSIHLRPLTISSFKPKIQVQGNMAMGEMVTVRLRVEFVDNVISQNVEKTFTNTTAIWLTDDDILRLFPSQNIIWAILVDAKSTSASTSASANISIFGIAT
jgi:hypothetical protein